MDFEILVLGPLLLRTPGGDHGVGGLRARRFLAALTISANHAIAVDRLADVVWGQDVPDDTAGSVHSMATRLRSICGSEALLLEDHSYRLVVDADHIDACRFEQMARDLDEAAGYQEFERVGDLARRALGLWRGPAYGDLADLDPFRLEAMRLEELRVSVTETLVTAELKMGHRTWALPMLRSLIAESPYREPLWRLLMEELCHAGRRGEAVEVFDEYTATLAAIGLSPDPAIERALVEACSIDLPVRPT